jgi:hypothetical protein
MSVRATMGRHASALAAAGAGFLWFLVQAGPAVLDPRRVGWVLSSDWAAGYVGWSFFRGAAWAFPLGANPGYPYPVGSTLAYSDSLPLVAVLVKPLSGLLPHDFQYIGPWLALAFALQGFAGAKLVALATRSRAQQALGGALFALSPVLVHRMADPGTGHASLCGQFLVVAALWLALAPCADRRQALRRAAAAAALIFVATGIHPYLVVMAVALTAAFAVRVAWVDRALGPLAAAAIVAGAGIVAAAGLFVFGYLTGIRTSEPGFGYFSADLLALWNPMDWSRLWPGLPHRPGQYEGFGYLGAGVLLAGAVALAAAIATRRPPDRATWKRLAPAAAVCAALFVVALSGTVTLAGRPILVHRAFQLAGGLAGTFRSSGRFVWAIHYLALAAAVLGACAALRERPRVAVAVLAVAVALQVIELRPPLPPRFAEATPVVAGGPAWEAARGAYAHLALLPPYLLAGGREVAPDACGPLVHERDAYVRYAELARGLGMTVNSAYLARIDTVAAARACLDTGARLSVGALDPDTIYVVTPAALAWLRARGARCGTADGIPVCVRADRADAFAEALRGDAGGRR